MRNWTVMCVVAVASLAPVSRTLAQNVAQNPAMERVTFDEAVARAIERNPSAAQAAAQILNADALLRQARAATLLNVSGGITSTTLNTGVEFDGTTVVPRSQVTGTIDVAMPLYAPVEWARKTQAQDQQTIAQLNAAEVRRQIAFAAADTYLAIIGNRRIVEANQRAVDVAQAHYDFAHTQQVAGAGSLLNELRAQQQLSSDQVLLEGSRLVLYRTQEALGVLMAADGPADAVDEPTFEVPPVDDSPSVLVQARPDLRLFAAQERAATRVVNDSVKDRLPSLQGIFEPAITYPSQFFTPDKSWRAILQVSVPIFDSGQRSGLKQEREASLAATKATFTGGVTQARSEVRAARESIRIAERALASARAGADQARRVVEIVDISFRAGASTNIEVVDAQRASRDADYAVAVAEDTLLRAKLDLLTALGRFPG
jgi:outer membrane protein TolC